MRRRLVSFVALALAAAASLPAAATAAPFGRTGQLFFAGRASADAGFVHVGSAPSSSTEWSLHLRPTAAVFFAPIAFVSLDLTLDLSSDGPTDAWSVGLGPAVGMRLALGEHVQFLPALGLGFGHTASTTSPLVLTYTDLKLEVGAPFLFPVAGNVGITVGPVLRQSLVATTNGLDRDGSTQLTIEAGVLGWL